MAIDKTKSKQVLQRINTDVFQQIEELNLDTSNKRNTTNRSAKIRELIRLGLTSNLPVEDFQILATKDYEKVLLTLPNEMLEQIKEFQHANRIDNRTNAVLILIKMGLYEIQQ
ncbi:hypothetical protein [Enterococcus sp. CR-Ec1]|uniref:hypothetical protein n=1 Tax=Enterococcus sp. CR-Ec1 TaxID=2057791 RepID=UPI000C7581F0|nr:hypothetical protein [Enterococcus sp. CR-Ec1]AUJ87448.1 hypothetical protein CXM95_18600 [Enterococcus sp. CR-Ec1]